MLYAGPVTISPTWSFRLARASPARPYILGSAGDRW